MTESPSWSDQARADTLAENGGSYFIADRRFGDGDNEAAVRQKGVKDQKNPPHLHRTGSGHPVSDSDLDPFWPEQGIRELSEGQVGINQRGAAAVRDGLEDDLKRYFDERADGNASVAAALRRANLMRRNRDRGARGLPLFPIDEAQDSTGATLEVSNNDTEVHDGSGSESNGSPRDQYS